METEHTKSPADLNDLFNYDAGLDDIFEGNAAQTANVDIPKPPTGNPSALGLGLDEEVKVTKKRQPVVKLDEGRLLSQPGIPKLRRAAKQKLKFKGKGHEFSDAARLLNFYQLWLDDLFPRAKFADGLAIIEKLGHSKRMQTMRWEWIEEEKPKLIDNRDTLQNVPDSRDLPARSFPAQPGTTAQRGDSFHSRSPQDDPGIVDSDQFMPDAQGETLAPASYAEPNDDDLEDLLREQDETVSGAAPGSMPRTTRSGDDDFDAEYEAMNELGI